MRAIRAAALAAALALCGCASTFSEIRTAPPGGGVPIANKTIATDLQDAAWNVDQAVAIGALAPDDPAPACLHDILVKAGIELLPGAPAAQSFVPKNGGLASVGSVLYIMEQQAKAAQAAGGFKVAVSCEALVGRITIDGVKAANKAAASAFPITSLLR